MKNKKHLERLIQENKEGKELTEGEIKVLNAYLESVDSKAEELTFSNMNGFFEAN